MGGRVIGFGIIRRGLVTLVSSLSKRSMTMHSICDPSKVRFTGPLAPFASGLAAELNAMGYATTSAANQLRLAAHLSRWLEAQHLEPGDLPGPHRPVRGCPPPHLYQPLLVSGAGSD